MKQQCHTITKNQNVSSPDLQTAISKETRVGKYGRIIKVKHTFLLRSSNVWKLNWKAFLLARQYTCPVFPWIHLFNVCAIIFSIFNTSTLRVDDANNFPFPLQQQKEAKIRKKKKKKWIGMEARVEIHSNCRGIQRHNNAIARTYTRLHCERLYFISCCILLLTPLLVGPNGRSGRPGWAGSNRVMPLDDWMHGSWLRMPGIRYIHIYMSPSVDMLGKAINKGELDWISRGFGI